MAWWRRWPDANLGVITGPVSGVVVVDVDPRNGGDRSLTGLEAVWGSLADTVEVETGGGGRHIWFRCEDGLSSGILDHGLEFKCLGGIVVAPPSVHRSGRRYRWLRCHAPWQIGLARLPGWLASLVHGEVDIDRGETAPPRAHVEQVEFAAAWRRVGIELMPGDRTYLCPFHDDHHPSLHIDADGCRWFCFGCRRGGGIGGLRRLLGDVSRPIPRSRLASRRRSGVPITLGGSSTVDVVGESRHQDELLSLTGGVRRYGGVDVETVAELVPEPENHHDRDAVRVEIDGQTVGYLRHEDALDYQTLIEDSIDMTRMATCRARIRGGWNRGADVGAFGVTLLLPRSG